MITTHLLLATLGWCACRSTDTSDDRIAPFAPDRRLIAAYYFNWYIRGTTHKCYAWKVYPDPDKDRIAWTWPPYYPSGREKGAQIFGLHEARLWPGGRLPDVHRWPDSAEMRYHIAELRAMKWAGLDFAFVDLWYPHDFRHGRTGPLAVDRDHPEGSPGPELEALFRAWQYLDARGEEPVKLAPFIETPAFQNADVRGRPPGDPSQLFEPLRLFFRQFFGEAAYAPIMPKRALAAVADAHGRPRPIVHFFYPRILGLPHGDFIVRWDEQTFADLRVRFRRLTGLDPYISVNQHVHGPKFGGWDGVQKDGSIVEISRRAGVVEQEITWHATLLGPRIREDSIAVGTGYFRPHRGDKRPGGDATRPDGTIAYPRAYRYASEQDPTSTYEDQWLEVLADPANFKRHWLVIECWNELAEGSQISPARPKVYRDADGAFIDRWGDEPTQYLELTRKFARYWHQGRIYPSAGRTQSHR